MKKQPQLNNNQICQTRLNAIRDAMEILSGKWKLNILGTIIVGGKMRFMDLQREIHGIGSKMLAKELQDMEVNQLLTRTVLDTKPVTVEYEISEYGKALAPMIDEMVKWGIGYRDLLSRKSTTKGQFS
ncbi:winged helix-turn-helix transcriptional regulator [Pedobacter rhizosphaerae]|uniref:Transcriptional regulator, HxlR family n=1 Tax=Pedobacter rhizosphaerae TaxID=390241 RepID=A0A1H9SV78_9SPHI|nr:helix-turn-helix domain-containing protein [Pedobacter rhizosphaerae]SER88798.1 transcriptional regulator, HxlR family [Pedobacter rhizosphaerae]